MKKSEYEIPEKQYDEEVRERWGSTDAYRQHKEKTKGYTKEQWDLAADGMNRIFAEFSACMKRGLCPDSDEAAALAAKLQKHITEYYYDCTPEILAGLGMMYTSDERFRKNIDKNGEGTAKFASDSIAAYCRSV